MKTKRFDFNFKPLQLNITISVDGSVPDKQNYNADADEYTPDYTVTPLILQPLVSRLDKDEIVSPGNINTLLANVKWYEIVGGVRTLITSENTHYEVTASGGQAGRIKVKKNGAADGKKRTYASVDIDIEAIENPELDAQLVAENIADQLEKRIAFRRAMKNAIDKTMMAGAKGIKVQCSGRLAGADIARSEIHSRGTIPLQMLRADINYGFAEANTTYGKVGVKVWIYEGEILPTTRREGQRDNDRRGRKFDNKRPARRRNGGREGSDK